MKFPFVNGQRPRVNVIPYPWFSPYSGSYNTLFDNRTAVDTRGEGRETVILSADDADDADFLGYIV